MVITRFAPSPTGDPHIGNIRTTLFEYLFAKSQNGKFLLRIEDTDRQRYVENSVATLKDALTWLGLIPDNIDNPMVQSKRLDIYKKAALELVAQGKAYICTCSKERLAELREIQSAVGQPPKYDGCCRDRLKVQNEKLDKIPPGAVIRMKMPQTGKIVVDDLVRGSIEFDLSTFDDQVLLKSDGFPTYHLASVIDDHEMQITHVLRSEEWLPSTPKHLVLYQMFGWERPKFAHLTVILSPTRGKLSKRDGAVGILEYRRLGYLPEALINFMALLGWNPKTEEEFFTLTELEKTFSLENVNRAAAVFDVEKLNFFNQHYLRQKSAKQLIPMLDQEVLARLKSENLGAIVELAKQRMVKLSDFADQVKFVLEEPTIDSKELIFRKSDKQKTKLALQKSAERLEGVANWNQDAVKSVLNDIVGENNLTNGDVFWSIRYTLSGEPKSPPPEELAVALGKVETVKRIRLALAGIDI